ncbi:MAG: IPT/TIG domain-containing protein, partial [Cocleimonas sp.]|nr:IPT/TIG domain-containing protein [Cocleimonas sp.]
GDCVHQLPYKFYLKHVPTNQITTVSQGNVDVCGNSVILDKQSSVRLSKSGVYKFWAQIYPPAGADSHAADNKTSEMTITVGDDKKPDLSIGSLAFPRHVKQNTNTSVSVRVSNIGAKASTSTRVGVYLSNNSSNGGKTGLSDKPLAVFNVPVIAANASKPFTKNDIKFSQTGQKYIYACVTEIKDEKSTVNNCSASKPITITEAKKYPDLLAISPVISGTPKVGQTLNIKMTVKNIGGKASPTTNIGFYTSANSTKDINDKRLTLSSISALSAGSSKVISGQVKFPKAGDLWVFSCVNFVSDEQNRDNNCSALKKITVKNADSVISSITPKTAEQNKPTVFTVKGSNLSSTLKLSVDGCKLPTQYSPSSTQVQMRCTPTLSGIKRGYVKDNGVVIKTFTVQIAPTASDDFYLTSTTLTASRLSAGSRVTARGYQRYNGTSGAYKKPYLGYYLSRDQVLDTSDKLLATDISYLKSTRRYNYESASLLIPSSTSTGQYYILFIADYKKNYAESNENNNVQAVSLTVTDSGGNKASVSSVAPVSAVYGRKTSFTVTGKNLPSTLAFWMSQCINVRKLSSTSTRVLFSCTPSYSAGSKSGIVKDKPGGKTLRSFRVNVTKSTQNSSDDFYVNSSRLSSSTVSSGRYIYGYTKQYYTGTKRTTQLRRPYPYVGYFLSKDSQWDSSDKRLAHDASSIGSNDRYDPESARLTIPSGTKAGRYYILFVADYKKSYAESNERNNLQSVFLTVR